MSKRNKMNGKNKFKFCTYYENILSKYLAVYFKWLYFPIYLYFRVNKVMFPINMLAGVGHIIPEMDDFFRRVELGEISKKNKYIFLTTEKKTFIDFAKIYKNKFYKCWQSNTKYLLLLPLIRAYSSLTVDVGNSRRKIEIKHPLKIGRALCKTNIYTFAISEKESSELKIEYFKRRAKTLNFTPLRFDDRSINFLDIEKDTKICLMHVRTSAPSNAVAKSPDPKTYFGVIDFLKSQNYTIIGIGREAIPECFLEKGVVDYARSKYASFENDLRLFNRADLAIINGAGTFFMADCFDTPLVYINSWNLFYLPFHSKTICVPCLIRDKNSIIKFSQQHEIVLDPHVPGSHLPKTIGEENVINATDSDILEAAQELFSIINTNKKPSRLQKAFNNITSNGSWAYYSKTRVSQKFLELHQNLI